MTRYNVRWSAATPAHMFGIFFLISFFKTSTTSVSSMSTGKVFSLLGMKHHNSYSISDSVGRVQIAVTALPLSCHTPDRLRSWRAISTARDAKDSKRHRRRPTPRLSSRRVRCPHPSGTRHIYIHRKTILKTTRVARLSLLTSQLIWKPATTHHTYEPRTVVNFVTGCTSTASQFYPPISRSTPPQFSPHRDTRRGTFAWCMYDDDVETYSTWYCPQGQLRVSRPPHQLRVAAHVLRGAGASLTECLYVRLECYEDEACTDRRDRAIRGRCAHQRFPAMNSVAERLRSP